MKVVYTAAARQDLQDIGNWLALHYPPLAPAVERRIRIVVARIALRWKSCISTMQRVNRGLKKNEPRRVDARLADATCVI